MTNQFTNVAVINNISKEEIAMTTQSINAAFASHLNDEKLIAEMKGKSRMAKVQKISLRPKFCGKAVNVFAKITTADVKESPFNKDYLREGVTLQNALGNKSFYPGLGSEEIVIVDLSAIASIDQGRLNSAIYMMEEFWLVELEGRIHVLQDVSDTDKPQTVFADLCHMDKNGDYILRRRDVIFTPKGNIRRKAHRFSGEAGCTVFSSSQGRKKQFCAYETTTMAKRRKFLAAMEAANLGEYELTKKNVVETSPKGAADACTRNSSKTTSMNLRVDQGCGVKTVAVLFNTDKNSDGRFIWSAPCVAKNILAARGTTPEEIGEDKFQKLAADVTGYLLQSRPFTVKAAGLVMDQAAVDMELRNFNLLRIDVTDKGNAKLLQAVNTVLNKELRSRAGVKKATSAIPGVSHVFTNLPEELREYDGVVLCHEGMDMPVEMACNLDAMKDHYDLRLIDGVNVLSVAHMPEDDWMRAATSAQFNKVVLCAVHDMPELRPEYDRVMLCGIIKRAIDMAMDFSAKPKKFGAEMIDTGYVANVVRDLNPNNIAAFPSVYQGMVNDAKNRVENIVNFDAYSCPGHFGMFTSDPAYNAWGKSVLNVTDKHIQVYDPVFNRYAALFGVESRHGVAIKYPAMGTKEILFVEYISDEEVIARTQALGEELDRSQEDIDIMIGTYQTLKEGAVILPADLGMIGMIAAGSDLDGDKAGFFFEDPEGFDLVHILWQAMEADKFSWKAVDIGNNGKESKAVIKLGESMYQQLGYLQVATGNYDVGVVTNAFRILTEGLLVGGTDEVARGFYAEIFHEVFNMGTKGHGAYKSPIRIEDRNGLNVFCTVYDIVAEVMKAIAKSALTWNNIQTALNDLDVVGRHVQELTIDAQKKFNNVECPFIEALRKNYSILPLKSGIQFHMNWKEGADNSCVTLVENDGYKFVEDTIRYVRIFSQWVPEGTSMREVKVLADAFAPYRAYAATYAMKKLNEAREEYFNMANANALDNPLEEAYNRLVKRMPAAAQARVNHAIRLGRNANTIYKHHIRALEAEYLHDDLSASDAREIRNDIAREAREKFAGMLDNASNEIRCVAEECGLDAKNLVLFAAEGKEVASGVMGRFLKEETCYYLAAKSEISEVRRELYGIHAAAAMNSAAVHVSNGEVVETGTRVNLMDGTYTVEANEEAGTVELVRPLTDYVEIPKADHSRITFGLRLENEHVLDVVNGGDKVTIQHIKNEKGRDEIALFDAEGMYVTALYCGNFSRKNMVGKEYSFNVIAPRFENKAGIVTGLDISRMEKDKNDNSYCYAIVTISEVEEYKAEDCVVREEAPAINLAGVEEADILSVFDA